MGNFCGIDVGSANLVSARRNANNEIEYKRESNAFVELPLENRYMFNMMKKSGVKLIEKKDIAYIVGQDAQNLAYSMNQIQLRRPMQEGCLNPKEKDAFFILGIMLHSLIGKVDADKTVVYYTVPANSVNEFSDASYHQKVLAEIFSKYKVDNKTVVAFPLNEALAIVFAELEDKQFTGIGVSCGGGMSNVCYSIFGVPVFSFSIINSGDWIDNQASKATNESVMFINKAKEKIDLTKQPTNMIERAITAQYRIMIEKTIAGIVDGVNANSGKFNLDNPVDIVISGGTSTPNGFENLFKEALVESKFPITIGVIRKPKETLTTVAKGCLVAAENSVI